MPRVTLDRARAAKPAALRQFKRLGKVVGVGITRIAGEYALKVNLREPVEPGVELPAKIEGVSVRVEITGSIRPRSRSA